MPVGASAEHAVPADRFAPEIVPFLKASDAARSRQLNAKPLGGWGAWWLGSFCPSWLGSDANTRCARLVVPVLVVLAWFDRPWCGVLVVQSVIVC